VLVGVADEGQDDDEQERVEKEIRATFLQDLASLLTTGRFSDVELYVHPQAFSLHRYLSKCLFKSLFL